MPVSDPPDEQVVLVEGPWRHHEVTAGGLRIHVAEHGPADGPLVLLLHGFPESWYSWRHQIGPLAAAGFRVVAVDQRGYNFSAKAPPYDLATLAGDVSLLIQACGRSSARLVGHDFGASVAGNLAGRHPEQVERLAIVNVPHPAVMVRALRRDPRQLLRSWYVFLFQVPGLPEWLLSSADFAALRRSLRVTSAPGTFTERDLDAYVAGWSRPGALSAMIGWYRAAARLGWRIDPDRFEKIVPPTLILWGDRDVALRPELADQSLAYCADGRLRHFASATHWLHEEHPDAVNSELIAFLT